ncbi:hypothetical protein BN1723_008071 [Verticillium longisporum]|uniref:Uncharacterized protein n=1 Tax=Verticillium longisporum TaxID=100787 RepID=A0A0G4NQC2_VERLO|nr:hypothetical protein BN1723_008071 [Verticillium longisporum]
MAMCSRSAWHCLHRLLGVEVFLASAYNVASDVRLEHRPWMEPPWLRRLCLEGKPSGEFLGRKRTATWTTRRYGKHGECRLRGRQTNGNDKATSKLQVGAAGAICVADLSGSEGPLGTRRERGHRQKKKKFRQQAAQSRRSKSPSWFQLSDGGSKWQVPTLKSAQQCQVSTSGGHEPSECSVELGRYDCATNVRRAQGSWKGSRRGRMIAGTAHTGTTFVSTTTMPLFESLLLCSDRPRLLDSFAKGKKGSYCRSRAGPCGTMWAGGQGRGGRGA